MGPGRTGLGLFGVVLATLRARPPTGSGSGRQESKQMAYEKVWDHSVVIQAQIFPYRCREPVTHEILCHRQHLFSTCFCHWEYSEDWSEIAQLHRGDRRLGYEPDLAVAR